VQSASVARNSRTHSILTAAALLLGLGGCATAPHWGVSGGDRDRGVVRLSYEYPEFHQPALSDEQALKTAVSRCAGWGYDNAEAIEGQLRQCSNHDGANCNLWTVTREYQCTDNAAFAGNLAK
jgi:YecR-like lipoprotein